MYADDQDEDVEEEEEFHEVEEEKHKTSQDTVNDSNGNPADSPEKPEQKTSKDIDWANIMLRSQSENSDRPEPAKLPTEHASKSDVALDSHDDVKPNDDSIMNNIIKDTQDKLKIVDESCDSIDQSDLGLAKSPSKEILEPVAETPVTTDEPPAECKDTSSEVVLQGQSLQDQPDLVDSCPQAEEISEPNHLNLDQSPESQPDQNSSEQQDTQTLEVQPAESENSHPEQSLSEEANHKETQQTGQNDLSEQSAEQATSDQADVEAHDVEDGKEVESLKELPDGDEKPDEKKTEEVEKKELDLDEDVKNPQYIPKKGVFYEHDDRSHDVEEKKASTTTKKEEDTVETKEASVSKRTPSQEKQVENRRSNRRQRTDADRWNHDLFRGEKQKPKSKSELISAYGYDIRQERGNRNQQPDNRQPRTGNSSNAERPQTSQDGQRSRQSKDGRLQRQNQPSNRSRERRARRQNSSKSNQQPRNDGLQTTENKRDITNNRSSRSDVKDSKDTGDEKLATQSAPSAQSTPNRRDQETVQIGRNPRNDSRGRRKTSRDRPSNEERLPPANAVMPPITTWSNEDMMKAEAFGKKSPPRTPVTNATVSTGSNNNANRDRSSDLWQQSQQNKAIYPDRSFRNQDETRQQSYNPRGRYQERGDENHRPGNMSRNHYHDRTNQGQDWNRANNFNSYGKSNDYIVKTQTFENSRLAQANMNRSTNNRDLREVINERRMQGQHNFQNKVHHSGDQHTNHRGSNQGQIYHHQYAQSHLMMHPHQMGHNQQSQAHMMQPQQALPSQQHPSQQRQLHHQSSSLQQASGQSQTNPQSQQTQLQNHRQQPATTQVQTHQSSSRQTTMSSTSTDASSQDLGRGSSGATSIDLTSSRPIIKTDAYTGNMHSHQQPLSQHSQNHRSLSGPMSQHGPSPATSHMVPSHMSAATQPQYYAPSPGSRDPSASAVATAYHGYMPGGHTVMDATRYHMASQQMTEHGYMTTPNQTSDVSGGPVLHQQGMYPDSSAGGAVSNPAFLTQHPGSTISPNTNIPITGAGTQLPPVSYIQHSQYPPPPYPYTQPQHNQGPQSGHAYPYWTYI